MTKAFCDSFLEMGLPGFDLAVFYDGREVLRYRGGWSDLERQIPVDGSERYHIYSCSKPITCVAAMQLWEEGLFSLEDPLSRYMPEFEHMTVKTPDGIRPAEKPILISHLFEMTAGFSYDLTSPELLRAREETGGRCPTRQVMKYLAQKPLLFEPGERWAYSLCHDVLAALVEVLSGQKFEVFVKEHVFAPLGMADSTFLLPEGEEASLAPQYCYNHETKQARLYGPANRFRLGTEFASGGAGCVSTVDDYMKFLEGLRLGRLLKKETVDLMRTNRLTEEQMHNYWLRRLYGYGLGVRCPKKGGQGAGFGWDGAAGAYLALDPERKLSVYMGTHTLTSPSENVRAMLHRLICCDLFGDYCAEELKEELRTIYQYHYFD